MYPLEPLFRSIYTLNPNFNPKPFDLVTDRNNLRKLLRVISGESFEPFRINIDLVNDTLLFTRWESNSTEYLLEFRGYGHEFEKCNTISTVKNSTGHHRIIQYKLGPLKALVRFEADAYIKNYVSSPRTSTSAAEVDKLVSIIEKMRLTSAVNKPQTVVPGPKEPHSSGVKIVHQGISVPNNSIVEIKTRAKHKPITIKDVAPQLFFAQVSHLIVGYHSRGRFDRLEKKDFVVDGSLNRFEMQYADDLRKLIRVIEMVKKELVKLKEKRVVLLCERGRITVYERTGGLHSLPPDLLAKWK